MSQKAKMCKSPKNIVYSQSDKIEYENLNTNCTIVGSNNLHLVKKPQIVTSMSPAYSNPSPGYPQSPYSNSPASLKSPSPQLSMKPPTPQPNTFPVMQIIHNSPVIARPIHTSQQQNVIKIKPPLNILPKPSASPLQSPKPSVSPQIVLPANQQATIMPTAQPLVLNQMPMLAPGVQFILRPQSGKLPTQAMHTPQGLILQQSGQQLVQLQPPRSQPMMRVLTNGVGLPTTTYVAHMTPQNNVQHSHSAPPQSTPPKKKPNKKKKQKLDLANIMKLSGIGDDDDVQFESDASQSENEHNTHSQPVTPQPGPPTPTLIQPSQVLQPQGNMMQHSLDHKQQQKVGNIQISAVPQTINTAGTPLVQVLNQTFQGGPQQQAPQQSIPFNPFITPNFTINNGLMVQRSGGFKLALGEDGRLVLQHDPTLNQDLNSQLLLQSIFGLNGGLVLQPSIDQQIHSQTVQTIQQQSVQTIQQQTVQSQTIQTVQHQIVQPQTIQSIQSQIQGQIQSLLQQQNLGSQSIAIQPQNITIQPQGLQGLQVSQPITIHHSQPIAIHSQSQPITIQAQSQPITIQSQSHSQPISLQSNVASQSQIINLSQANQVFTGNNVPQGINTQSLMQIQSQSHNPTNHQSPNLPQVQMSNHQTITPVSSQSPMMQQQQQHTHTFTQNSAPLNISNHQHHPGLTTSTQGNLGTQPVLKVQPFQKTQPPVQTVHPIHHHNNHQQQQQQQPPPPPTSYVVNLTPDQLEQLKRNGQLTVNGQTIFMQRPKHEEVKKTSPKIKPIKKVSKIPTVVKEVKMVNNLDKTINNVVKESLKANVIPNPPKCPPVTQVSVQTQVTQTPKIQPSAIIQPSVQPPPQIIQPKIQIPQPKVQIQPSIQVNSQKAESPAPPPPNNPEVDRFQGQQSMDDTPSITTPSTPTPTPNNTVLNTPTPVPVPVPVPVPTNQAQRVHTIQLTPQKQQHLKSIQLQIQTLSARLTPGNTEMQNALKLLFQEQQKILATGKLLPPDKVFYHNNQLIVNNSVNLVKNEVISTPPPRSTVVTTAPSSTTETKPVVTTVPSQPAMTIQPVPIQAKICMPTVVNEVTTTTSTTTVIPQKIVTPVVAPTPVITPTNTQPPPPPPSQPPTRFIPLYTKAQLIEQQLNTDQNGAIKPDIHTPFKDKADACKRLIRYHCFDQPVLSQKDLNKADEIFELTARHFIDKFGRMVDKYRFLLHKESQRHVQTSELMMLDRMFLSEEQQSLIKLRQEIEDANMEMQMQQNPTTEPAQNSEEYDEWACIQRELGCLPLNEENKKVPNTGGSSSSTTTVTTSTVSASGVPVKRSSSTDSRMETLKKFRVDKHCKKSESMLVSEPSTTSLQSVNAPHFSQSNPLQTVHTSNTTVLSSSSSTIHGTTSIHTTSTNYSNGGDTNILQSSAQRSVLHAGHASSNVIGRTSCTMTSMTSNRTNNVIPSSGSSSRSNSIVPSDSNNPVVPPIAGNTSVQTNSNMSHALQNMHNSLHSYNSTMHIQNPMQRVHSMSSVHPSIHHQNLHPLQHVVHNSTHQSLLQRGVHNMQQYSTQHIVQHITHTVHHTQQIQNSLHSGSMHSQNSVRHSSSVHSQNSYSSGNEELDNNDSIDEQVQSAIDSILNLQQNTSLELDETMQNMLS